MENVTILKILGKAAIVIAIAAGVYHVMFWLWQIPGNRKIDRVYAQKTEDENKKKVKSTILLLFILLYICVAGLLFLIERKVGVI